ncbi:plasmid mobilization protein [Phaeobacter sp. JH20_32]|uniref:plasmid mobilization protein n=1 Tax=Phaeobacter sp. JH20_32 TaxID=3112489 RepID=UPI003A85D2F5
MARPKKSADEKRTEQMNTRWTLAERETLRTNAARVGLDDSEFLRHRALGIPLPSSSSSADPALIAALNAHAVALTKIGNNVNQLAAAAHQGRDFVQYWREIGAELEADLSAAREALNRALEDMDG